MINGIFNEVPFNYGVIKSINVTAPENTLVNAKSPAPIEGMSMTFDILTSTIMGAFSHVVPDRVIACMGGVTNILWGAWNPHHEPPRYFVAYVAIEIGWAPTVDVRDMLPDRYVQTLFLNKTSAIHGLYQFDAPSSPEKWERIWSEVEAA